MGNTKTTTRTRSTPNKTKFLVVDVSDNNSITGKFDTLEEAEEEASDTDVIVEMVNIWDVVKTKKFIKGDINDWF